MKKSGKQVLLFGGILIVAFAVWTALIQMVDVQPLGQNGTNIGFATFNCWFHRLAGVNMTIYTITDWMGLIPLVVSRVMRKFDLALAEIYFRGRVHAPWLPSSGQGAKGQGRRYAARLALDAL